MITRDDDIRMIDSPGEWPSYPWLPVKRYVDGELEIGVIDAARGPLTVWLSNMFELDFSKPVEGKEYTSAEAMVDDGWMVD